MHNFVFHNPTEVIFGKKTIPRIGRAIRLHGFSNVLLMAGQGSIRKNGVYDAVVASLRKNKVAHVEQWHVTPNPGLECVHLGIQHGLDANVDAVLAVGGGSVVDAAKVTAAGIVHGGVRRDGSSHDAWSLFEVKQDVLRALPVFCVLTCSGSGSEANNSAILTNETRGQKWGIKGPALFPVVSILDPRVQSSLPWEQTLAGGIDAFTHLLEHYCLGASDDAFLRASLEVNASLQREIIRCLDALQIDATHYATRASLVWASTLALNGISGAGLGGGDWTLHLLAHSVGALFPHVRHGHALSALLPGWLRFAFEKSPASFERWAQHVFSQNMNVAVKSVQDTLARWGAPTSLGQLGVEQNDVSLLVENVLEAAAGHGGPGRLFSLEKNELRALLTP